MQSDTYTRDRPHSAEAAQVNVELDKLRLPPLTAGSKAADPDAPKLHRPVSALTPATVLEQNSDMVFHSVKLHKGPIDVLADSLKSMPPSIYKVAIPDRGRSDGMVRMMTVQKVDDNTFFIRNDWECGYERSQLFAFKRDEQGAGWKMSTAQSENGKFHDVQRAALGDAEQHHSERVTFTLNKINANLSSLRNAAVIEGAGRHGWFDPAQPPEFVPAEGLTADARSIAKIRNGVASLTTDDGSKITLEKMDKGTFAVNHLSGSPPVKETVLFTESGGRWYAAALREHSGRVIAVRLDGAAQKTWSDRLEILGEPSSQRLMTGGYYDPRQPPEFRVAPESTRFAAEILNDRTVPPNKTIQRRERETDGLTNVLRVKNLGDGIFTVTSYQENREGKIIDSRCTIFQRDGAQLKVAMVDDRDGELINVRPREAARRLRAGGSVATALASLRPAPLFDIRPEIEHMKLSK